MKSYLFGILIFLTSQIAIAQNQIIPTPQNVQARSGQIIFSDGILSVGEGMLSKEEFDFFEKEFELHELELKTSLNPVLSCEKVEGLDAEAYIIDINSQNSESNEKIAIKYSNDQGKFYALISLLQLVEHRKEVAYIRNSRIFDAPAFSWRGLHLDVSRHFFSVDEVKRFIDLMVLYKFNTFHWHLTDDQGWRIEIEKYPKLTSVGAYRDSTLHGHYSDRPRTFDHDRYGGFYTKDQIRDVVAYAQARNVTIVPEIEMPGHSRAALAAYPELSCTGKHQGVEGLWGVFEDIYCSKESTIEFMQDVLDEVLELFPSEYIHIGGDEAPKARWEECPECAKVMKQNNLNSTFDLQSYFIGRMDKCLTERGRKLIGWDEILEGGLSPNAAVMSWRGEEGGIEAARQHHSVVMSPTSYCYFDYYQSSHSIEPLAIGGYLPLEKVYEYSPVPEELSKNEAKYVLGGQANVWTEYIADFEQVEYMVYPRALALIQSLWCNEKPPYEHFLAEYIAHQEDYLALHGVNSAKSIHFPELKVNRGENGIEVSWHTQTEDEQFKLRKYVQGFSDLSETGVLENGEIIFITKSDGQLEVPTVYEIQSDRFDTPVRYNFYPSACLGAKLEISPDPNKAYNHTGSLNLVDGILGDTERWKGDQWLGFRDKKITIKVDLGEVLDVSALSIGFLNQNGSWIYLPEDLEIEYSMDGKGWFNVATPIKQFNSAQRVNRIHQEVNFEARYLLFTVTAMDEIPQGKGGAGTMPWTFIDEIQVGTE